jgi:trigger factor
MKPAIKKLPASQVEVEVKLTDAEFKVYFEPAFEQALSRVQLKGFRPGMAPKDLAAQAVDHDKVFEKAFMAAVRATLDQIKIENDWTFIDQPRVEMLEQKDGVGYKAVLTLFPEIEMGDYKKIAAKVFSQASEIKIDEAEIEKTLKWLRESRAKVTLVDRVSANGDMIECDIETKVEGKVLDNASFKKERFVVGDSRFIKGFDEQLVNRKAGEEFSFSLVAPADYWQEDLRKKKLDFTVKIHGVYERTLPDLTDEFAQALGPSFKTVADITKNIREGLTQEKMDKEIERKRLEVLNQVVKGSKMELPEVMVSRTLDGIVADMKPMLTLEAGQTPEQLDKELRVKLLDRAKQNVASNLVLYKIAQIEKLEPTGEEVEAEAKKHQVDPETHYDYIYGRLQNQKVFQLLENLASKEK